MTKKNPLFGKVYQAIANFMRDEEVFKKTVEEHRKKLKAYKEASKDSDLSHDSGVEDRNRASDSAESEIQ